MASNAIVQPKKTTNNNSNVFDYPRRLEFQAAICMSFTKKLQDTRRTRFDRKRKRKKRKRSNDEDDSGSDTGSIDREDVLAEEAEEARLHLAEISNPPTLYRAHSPSEKWQELPVSGRRQRDR